MSGNVVVRPLTAKLLRNTEYFGKMDPLVKVIIGVHTQRTAIARRGHKNPGWETELSLRRSFEDIIHFEVWDKDIIKGDLIGMGDIAFNKIFVLGNRFNGWVPLKFKGKDAGELLVDILFIPDAGVNVQEQLLQSQSLQMSQQLPIPIQSQSSGQLGQSGIPQTQSVLVSRPPQDDVSSKFVQNLPEPTYLPGIQAQPQESAVMYSTPLSSYEKVTTTQHTHVGHAHCSVFHEGKQSDPQRDIVENREKEGFNIPKLDPQGLSERKPIFQNVFRGDTENPTLGTSAENMMVQKS